MDQLTPQRLFEENQDLAMWVANKFYREGEFEDIKQHALIGLFNAAQRFDASRGFSFSTFSVHHIKYEIIGNHFEKRHFLKVSRSILENEVKVKRFLRETEDVHMLSKLTGLPTKAVNEVLEYLSCQSFSLDLKVNEDGETTLGELIPGEVADWDEQILIKDFVATLDEREKIAIEMRFKDCSQFEIGDALGISQVHASRLLKKIKAKYVEYIA